VATAAAAVAEESLGMREARVRRSRFDA
jgi:hypothetical protein